ncbi:MAG: glycosyltransferase 87 family protein [Thermodesulfobacteriota bacterium]
MNLEVDSRYSLKNPYIQLSILLLIGFLFRIYFSTLISYEGDVGVWQWWGEGLSKVGFSKFYDNYWCDYMPGYLYVLKFLTDIQTELPWLSSDILFKLPANLSDLGISILIYLILKPISSTKIAIFSSIAYFYNPAALSNSTFWGQVDSFHAFPILLAIILGLRKKFVLAGLFAAVAFMIKPQTIVLFPIIGFIALEPFFRSNNRWNIKNFVPGTKIILTAIVTCIIITLPFIWNEINSFSYIFTGPFDLIKERFDAAYEQYKFASLNTFNFWGVFAMWTSDETIFVGLSYKNWGTLIFGAIYASIFAFFLRYKLFNKDNKEEYTFLIFQAVTLILFSLFLFVTRAHERHLLPSIVFFTLILYRSWIFPYLYAIVSGVYVCNMIYSYIELTTDYKGVSDILQSILVPVMFILYFTAFVIVLLNFFKHTIKKEDIVKT